MYALLRRVVLAIWAPTTSRPPLLLIVGGSLLMNISNASRVRSLWSAGVVLFLLGLYSLIRFYVIRYRTRVARPTTKDS